jgi:hypothetical protein
MLPAGAASSNRKIIRRMHDSVKKSAKRVAPIASSCKIQIVAGRDGKTHPPGRRRGREPGFKEHGRKTVTGDRAETPKRKDAVSRVGGGVRGGQ